MSPPVRISSALAHPDALVFPENQTAAGFLKDHLERFAPSPHSSGTRWCLPEDDPLTAFHLLESSTGHAILYGHHRQRILYTDPGGSALHECAWEAQNDQPARLLRARVQLDWGQWVGVEPAGLVNVARFDISRKPGWQRLTKQDFHRMASQAMGLTAEDVAFFYDEESLNLDSQGIVTVRNRKDALSILEGGRFDQRRFMACMGAMHWGRIDFLPVVELFQSLLPGTGNAIFELIRGLYDDQNMESAPRPLRYKGIPTYPSPQAFQLFSTYFQPDVAGRMDPFPLFMDPKTAGQVVWHPRRDYPRRYIDLEQRLCLTVSDGAARKVTVRDDAVAMPYTRPKKEGFVPGGRALGADKKSLLLQDGDRQLEIPLRPEWGVTVESSLPAIGQPEQNWRTLFPDGLPSLDVVQAYSAVPMYPAGDAMVDELATQPLVIEHAMEHLDRLPQMGAGTAGRALLIDGWDAVSAEIVGSQAGEVSTVLYRDPAFAQRQAQRVWDHAAAASRLSDLRRVSFVSAERHGDAYGQVYHVIFFWFPFADYRRPEVLEQCLHALATALSERGLAVVVGPARLAQAFSRASLRVLVSNRAADAPGVGMLRAILPKAQINPDATLFLLEKHPAA